MRRKKMGSNELKKIFGVLVVLLIVVGFVIGVGVFFKL